MSFNVTKCRQYGLDWKQRIVRLFPILMLLLLMLSGCSGTGTSNGRQDSMITCRNGIAIIPSPAHELVPFTTAHQPAETIQLGFDVTTSVERGYFEQAKRFIAAAIDRSVAPNEDGKLIFVNVVNDNSYRDDNALLTIRVPPVPVFPTPPAIRPCPVQDSDPLAFSQAMKGWREQTIKEQADYQATLKAMYAQLAAARAVVHQATARLLKLEPSPDAVATDEYGFFERATAHLQSGTGKKLLLLQSDLFNNTDEQYVNGGIRLAGVKVKIIWNTCPRDASAKECVDNASWWVKFLTSRGAASVTISDPLQSQALDDLLA